MKTPDCVRHLVQEHREAERLLSAFSAYLERLRAHPDSDSRDVSALMTYFLEYFFVLHEEKEEEVLLGEMIRQGCPQDSPTLRKIRTDHQKGQTLLASLRDALRAGDAWTRGERYQFLSLGAEWLTFIRAHMRAEEQFFFPRVGEWISEESDEWVMKQLGDLDAESQRSEVNQRARAVAEEFVVRFENDWVDW